MLNFGPTWFALKYPNFGQELSKRALKFKDKYPTKFALFHPTYSNTFNNLDLRYSPHT